MDPTNELRKIPSVSALLLETARAGVFAGETETVRARCVRAVVAEVRRDVQGGAACPELPAIVEAVRLRHSQDEAACVRRVVNATGIALHTNLGRAPLARAVMERVTELATGYCSLEIDLETGRRGKRADGVRRMLCAITGAEDAAVVNNGAAAVLLALGALAAGREVVISRGELVQIGGGFRVPDILAASGARLREVGTTNITTLSDYERAIGPDTALVLRVHRSNFHLVGHVEEPPLADLAALAHARGVAMAMDLGSGGFVRWRGHDAASEPTVQEVLRAGVDLATFSGDKLVGGPQAGLIVGRRELVARASAHPLYRALRAGRLTTVTLQEVLRYYLRGDHATLPSWAMIEMSDEEHAERTEDLLTRLAQLGIPVELVEREGAVGGGAAPGKGFPTRLVRLAPRDAEAFTARLRAGDVAVVPRVERDGVMLDVRTLGEGEIDEVVRAVARSWQA